MWYWTDSLMVLVMNAMQPVAFTGTPEVRKNCHRAQSSRIHGEMVVHKCEKLLPVDAA